MSGLFLFLGIARRAPLVWVCEVYRVGESQSCLNLRRYVQDAVACSGQDRCNLQVEQEPKCCFDLREEIRGKLAKLPFEVWFDESADTLNINHRGLIEKREMSYGNFIAAASVLRGERGIGQQRTRSFRIMA